MPPRGEKAGADTTRAVTVAKAVPFTAPLVAVITEVPWVIAVNTPVELIVPTELLLLLHVMMALIELPN